MDFKKKLKIRLWFALAYIVLGIAMIAVFQFVHTDNEFLSSFGFALIVVGVAKCRQYKRITKNEETIKKQQIAETDERNLCIASKAKSVAMMLYIILACVGTVVLHLLDKTGPATLLSGTVCALLLLYWISYWIISRKS